MRQGDPLSPLLFCTVEDVLSRGIAKQVQEGKVELINGSRQQYIPSHTLYADDVMVFCKGKITCINELKQLFTDYANCSGQLINPSKSLIFSNSIFEPRMQNIVNQLGFNIGSLPFTYLGVPIFKGRPKAAYPRPIADKAILKLASWKASLLSMAGRVQLVKSVIYSMLTHSLTVYDWPVSLLKELEKCIRNFIWSGDTEKRKLVTVAWNKICKPTDEGGLGLRSLTVLNEAANLKLCWDMLNSNEDWAIVLRSRVCPRRTPIRSHVFSSIWSSIKLEFNLIFEKSRWCIGDGQLIIFWNDNWGGQSLATTLNLNSYLVAHLEAKVSDFIEDFQWKIPIFLQSTFPVTMQLISQVTIPKIHMEDTLCWNHIASGILSLKDVFLFKSSHGQKLHWRKTFWSPDIPPSKSMLVWRILHDRMPTNENLIKRGSTLASVCSTCLKTSETTDHISFHCYVARKLWDWFATVLNSSLQFRDFNDVWTTVNKHWSPQCLVVIKACIVNILSSIWYTRNQARFQDKPIHWRTTMNDIISSVYLSGNNTCKTTHTSISEFVILKKFNISIHPSNAPSIKEVI